MLRAEIHEAFKPLVLTTLPVPPCPDSGFLLGTLYAGICHSDIHILDDEIDLGGGKVTRLRDQLGDGYKGLVMGHEICGRVLAVGNEVPSSCHISIGDVVIVYPWRGCRNCEVCNAGESQLCENNKGTTSEIGQGQNGGGYSTHVVVPEWELAVRLPNNIDPKYGCMLPCSALTAYSAVLKSKPALDLAVRVRGFANLLIVGAGGLGLWAVIIVKSVFCDKNVKVICADVSQEKLDLAVETGADDAVLWKMDSDDLVELTTMSGFNKIDAAIDFVGAEKTLSTAFNSLHHGGSVVSVGLRGGALPLSIPVLISRSISLHGVRVGGIDTLKNLVDLISVQSPDKLPSIELCKLEDVNEILERLRKREIKGRAILQYG